MTKPTNIDEVLEMFARWTIKNVEHGIYIPLPSPEAKAHLKRLVKEEVIGPNLPEHSWPSAAKNELKAEQRQQLEEKL